jgi:hypothetical protein
MEQNLVEYDRISYDKILGEQVDSYMEKHNNEKDVNKIIDIIRPFADQEYLDRVAKFCFNSGINSDSENIPNMSSNTAKEN